MTCLALMAHNINECSYVFFLHIYITSVNLFVFENKRADVSSKISELKSFELLYFLDAVTNYFKIALKESKVHLVYSIRRRWLCFCNNEMLRSVVVISVYFLEDCAVVRCWSG